MKSGRILKKMHPGQPGTKRWQAKYGSRLVCVRYRGDRRRRVRMTTIEIVVEEAFWDPDGFQNYKKAMSTSGHSA
jgi:hypothetical protein